MKDKYILDPGFVIDDPCILKDGEPMTPKQIVEQLNSDRLSLEYKNGELKKLESIYEKSLEITNDFVFSDKIEPHKIGELITKIKRYDSNIDLTRKYRGPIGESGKRQKVLAGARGGSKIPDDINVLMFEELRHPKCKGNYDEFTGDHDCGYLTRLTCEECKYGVGRRDPKAKCNKL